MKNIILASTSPRRKELLEQTGLPFTIEASDYEEDMTLDMSPAELAQHLSYHKAQAVADKHQNEDVLIIGADTFMVFNNEVQGKPHTAEKAKEVLQAMSGQTHEIITGYTVIDTGTNQHKSEAVTTKVHFRELTEQEIDEYIATGEPLDKAGAYAIQSRGGMFVDWVEGSYSNVVGLPISQLVQMLRSF